MEMSLNLKLGVDFKCLGCIICLMGLFQIITCKHVGVDPDTGDSFCKVDHLNPSGKSDEIKFFEGGIHNDSEQKTVPVCLPLRLVRKRIGSGTIASACDQAEEVATSIF